jgi:hypothetical protein
MLSDRFAGAHRLRDSFLRWEREQGQGMVRPRTGPAAKDAFATVRPSWKSEPIAPEDESANPTSLPEDAPRDESSTRGEPGRDGPLASLDMTLMTMSPRGRGGWQPAAGRVWHRAVRSRTSVTARV